MPTKPIFLMSPPKYYGVKYIINPWMQGNIGKVDQELAKQQWNQLYTIIKQYAEIKLVTPLPNLPDLVFTANSSLVKDKQVILSRFKHPERHPEESIYKNWFIANGFNIIELPNSIYFEGAGDALMQISSNILWMGYGIRSEKAACHFVTEFYHSKVVTLRLVDERFYHLDTCFCPLIDGHIMYYPDAFDEVSQQKIANIVPAIKRIIVSKEDAMNFACNAISIELADTNKPHGVIIMSHASDSLKSKLQQISYRIKLIMLTEFMKSGGAAKCLVLNLGFMKYA